MLDRRFPLQTLLDALGDAIVLLDGDDRIVYTNPAFGDLLGYASGELHGQSLDRLVPERYRSVHPGQVAHFRATALPRQIGRRPVLRALASDGSERAVTIMVSSLDAEGEQLTIAALRDATPVNTLLERAIARSQTDPLTGIGNRERLIEHMEQRIASGRKFGLLFLDLTGFKRFNDRYGHLAGDEVLRIVARRLLSDVRAGDLPVRWAGDEFVVVLDGLTDARALALRAAVLAAHLSEPFALEGGTASIGVSIGGALFPSQGRHIDELLAVADRAMYRAKERGTAFAFESGLAPTCARQPPLE